MRFIIFLGLLLIICSFSAVACEEQWQCPAWGSCHEGISARDCYDINSCFTLNDVPAETAFCREVIPYCYDDIINQDESDVDCGGKICDKCALGKECLSNSDCAWGECINYTCAFTEGQPASAAPSSYSASWALTFVIAMLAIAIVLVAISLMKKLKKQKIIVLTNKEVKERIILVSKMPKKSKLKKFVDNVNGYLDSIKPEPRREPRKVEKKDLLNEKSFKTQAHPAKEYMLSNIKEVYNE